MPVINKINCKACDEKESMIPDKISNMSPVVQVIGWIITVPSVIGVIFSVIMFVTSIFAGSSGMAEMDTGAGRAGAGIAAGIGMGIFLFTGISSLVGGLIGYFLIMKKKVYKCTLCSFVIDRA